MHGPGRAPGPTDDLGAIGALQRAGTREFLFLLELLTRNKREDELKRLLQLWSERV